MYVHVWVHPVKGIPHDSTPLGLTLDNAEQHVKLAGEIARFEIQNNLLLQPHYLNSHKSHKCSSPIWFADLATDRQESEHPVRVKLKDQKMPVDVDRGFSAACNKCRVSFESSAAEGFIKKARTVLEFQWFPCSVLQMDFIQASLQVQILDKSQWNEGLPWIYQNSVQDKDSGLASRKSQMKIQWKHFTVSLIFCFCMQAVEIGLPCIGHRKIEMLSLWRGHEAENIKYEAECFEVEPAVILCLSTSSEFCKVKIPWISCQVGKKLQASHIHVTVCKSQVA